MPNLKLRWLALSTLISSLGMSFIWPLTSVYLHNQLHISLTTIGVVLLINSVTSVLGSSLGGILYDRFNPFYLLIYSVSATFVILCGLSIWHSWPFFSFWLGLLGFCSGWNIALLNSISTSIRNISSKRVFNVLYLFQNLGVVIGSSLVGYFYSISVTLLFAVAAVLFLGLIVVILVNFQGINSSRSIDHQAHLHKKVVKLPINNQIFLSILFIALLIIWVMYQQWTSNVSVYMTELGFPLSKYSILWTINAGGIVLIQLILSYLNQYNFTSQEQIIFGISSLTISFVVLIFANQYIGFVIAMLLLTLGEATAFPAIPALVNRLSSRNAKGKYQGAVNAWASAGRALGPLIGGIIIETTSYIWLFKIAVILYIVVFILVLSCLKILNGKLTYFD
ncbi:MFS family major facilitator transporter [Secundilactobacillus odoratitofui DSM 19909 = JCM 15043]|uniref:MFS family major facilitator transporter n=3 Tax=Secundilactobacillus odoratitofui TaxID=480930 RepID=A0A0R1LWN4_9LACO|nr:MFS transporter [Secundilactobacillus odoratitofui]KRK97393.1 MFS family major facilitator transporter [Secundilactobacillus odoratitofui DSM 19909 = JCM 15043]